MEKKKGMLEQALFNCVKDDFPGVDRATKVQIMQKLIDKASNARYGMAEKLFSSQTIKRGGTNHQKASFRGELAVKVKGSEVDRKLLQTMDES